MWQFGYVRAFGYNSTESEPIWTKSAALYCLGLALANFGHETLSSDSLGARRNLFFVR